jgi:hypothetical protein
VQGNVQEDLLDEVGAVIVVTGLEQSAFVLELCDQQLELGGSGEEGEQSLQTVGSLFVEDSAGQFVSDLAEDGEAVLDLAVVE